MKAILKTGLATAALLFASIASAADIMEARMCATTDSGGMGARVYEGVKCEVRGRGNSWAHYDLSDLFATGWRVAGMSSHVEGSSATTQFLLVRTVPEKPAVAPAPANK